MYFFNCYLENGYKEFNVVSLTSRSGERRKTYLYAIKEK